ncbi:prepilin-type N-terminal cleavage/methylation domain-containing protein [Lysobacter tyrosinilyticus]
MTKRIARSLSPASRHSRGAFSRLGGSAAKAAGFTLIEVLIATVLLAAGLTLAFATIGAATKTTQRGEAMAAHSERIRAVEGFLRRRLEAVRPIPFNFDQSSGSTQRFLGERDRMRFVADLPDYLGRGGPYLHDFAIEDGGERITLALSMVLAGQTIEETQPRPPEVLVEGLKSARFRYRSYAAEGGLDEWQEEWKNGEQLPLMVEITLTDGNGEEWPPIVVALPLAAATTSGPVPPVTQ